MSDKMRVLIDMDGVIVDLLGPWLRKINSKHGTFYTKADITQWAVHKCMDELIDPYDFLEVVAWSTLPEMPGALKAVRKLIEHPLIDVTVVTAPAKGSEGGKRAWIDKRLPELPNSKLCMYTEKQYIKGDVLIDDKPQNLVNMYEQQPTCKRVCFAHPYNSDRIEMPCHMRSSNWEVIRKQVEKWAECFSR